jgi:hypothetical protein
MPCQSSFQYEIPAAAIGSAIATPVPILARPVLVSAEAELQAKSAKASEPAQEIRVRAAILRTPPADLKALKRL